jgi:hypothetical protein
LAIKDPERNETSLSGLKPPASTVIFNINYLFAFLCEKKGLAKETTDRSSAFV